MIDFETTGIPGKSPTSEIVTLGYFNKDKVTVLQRRSRKKEDFYPEVKVVLESVERPFYAFNAGFERDVMLHELGLNVPESDFVDLMGGWMAEAEEAGIKWPGLGDLMSEPEDYFHEEKITGADIPILWEAYLQGSGEERLLDLISSHCLSDVLREVVLLLRYPERAVPLSK